MKIPWENIPEEWRILQQHIDARGFWIKCSALTYRMGMFMCSHNSGPNVYLKKHIQMCTHAQNPKLTQPRCPKMCYLSVSLHLSSLIHLSAFCLAGRGGQTEEEKETHREALGWHAGGLDGYRTMWRGLSSLNSPLPLNCLHSLYSTCLPQSISLFF